MTKGFNDTRYTYLERETRKEQAHHLPCALDGCLVDVDLQSNNTPRSRQRPHLGHLLQLGVLLNFLLSVACRFEVRGRASVRGAVGWCGSIAVDLR